MERTTRKGVLVTGAVMVAVMTMSSAAYACVTFRGRMTVTGERGATTVEGHGFAHEYCNANGEPNGRPRTAAAGAPGSKVVIATSPGVICGTYVDGAGISQPNQLPAGTYDVKFNQGADQSGGGGTSTLGHGAYYFDEGTGYWTMYPKTGCFRFNNAGTTTTLGTMTVGSDGVGQGTFTLSVTNSSSTYASDTSPSVVDGDPMEAYNICIGQQGGSGPTGTPGLLAPFQLTAI